jgi:uracil-DNA glycosylase family 4
MADCESCPLKGAENAYVPSKFPAEPKLIVVGEAPTQFEAQRGIPFVGPSGRLINTVLKNYKWRPSEVGYTNVCLCRPPGNSPPPKAAAVACRQRLLHELAGSGATSILALGGTAAEALVDDGRTISKIRVGPAKSTPASLRDTNIERVVPSWNPAYCLRNADAFPSLVTDVGKLRGTRRAPWQPPKYYVIDEEALAIEWLNGLTAEACVVDIEVGIEKDISFGHPNTFDMLCIGLQMEKGVAYVLGENALTGERKEEVYAALSAFFKRTKIIAHNGKFDLAGLFPHIGGHTLWFDTMLAHYALDERPGTHGLKVLATELLGAPKYDDEIFTYVPRGGNYAAIPRSILYKYNAYDVSCTWDLYELFQEQLDRDGVRRVHDHLVRASNELMYLELNGIAIDRAYSNELQGRYLTRIEEIESNIRAITKIATFNPRSPKQVKEFLYANGIRVASTNADTLDQLSKRVDSRSSVGQFIGELLQSRRESKLYGTYVAGIRKRLYRGRVYTTYMLHGTTSGRLASRNPNLQNVVRAKDIRRQFSVSHPDNVLIQADYKQAEGRVIATLAGDEYLRGIFADPTVDLFNTLGSNLYKCDPSKLTKDMRVRTKAFFYGLGYGRTAFTVAQEYDIPLQEAELLMEDFKALIPATVKWQRDTERRVLSGEDLVTPYGRKRRFHLITDDNRRSVLNEALSYLPQSTASDICLSALIRLRPMLRGLGWIRLTIHDALVVECPERNRDRVSDLLRSVMLEEGRRFTNYVPFEVDVSWGKTWGDL